MKTIFSDTRNPCNLSARDVTYANPIAADGCPARYRRNNIAEVVRLGDNIRAGVLLAVVFRGNRLRKEV